MQLTPDQVTKFVALHERYGGLGDYTNEQLQAIAQGAANFYLALAKTFIRLQAEGKENRSNGY